MPVAHTSPEPAELHCGVDAQSKRTRSANWDAPITVPFTPNARLVKRLYTTEQVDSAVSLIIERVMNSLAEKKCRIGMISIGALWQDDFYMRPIYGIHGQVKSPKRDHPIYLAVSCSQLEHTILCEPSSLPAETWWKSLLPLLTNEKIVKVFWDGRILLSALVKNFSRLAAKNDSDEGKRRTDAFANSLRQNCLVISLALIVKKNYIDEDSIRSRRSIMRLPTAHEFLPYHADPVEKMILHAQALLLSGNDAAATTTRRKKQWFKLLQLSEAFLTTDKGVKVDPLPYVPLDVFNTDHSASQLRTNESPNEVKKFRRFMVHCVDCRRSVPTCLTDPVNITIHGNASDPEPKLPSKSPGNVYAAYRCRVCAEVLRPCRAFKAGGKCDDHECANIHMLLYCPEGTLCCEHLQAKTCPFTHPDEISDVQPKNTATVDSEKVDPSNAKWGSPRVHLGMPAWTAASFQTVASMGADRPTRSTKHSKSEVPSLYKVPCPDFFSSGKCSQMNGLPETEASERKSKSLCPFAHEPIPVFVPIPVPVAPERIPKGGLSYCSEFSRFGTCGNADQCEKIHQPPQVLDSPSLSMEEFSMYYQNMKSELGKLVVPVKDEVVVL
ncbi:Ribonuclease D [Perkinsela sp. CCAP 1560/4]|nr:Ribonuclease D [Perkinsela sp. CCAP 1560/4]|eukprot:KNH05743.1 Ribonuclease D [Perkinsela sp. CCAP 1560/4]